MEETALDKISLIFILLVTISAHHFYFGKDIPKWSWYLSIMFSIIAGMYLGFVIALFPGNLIMGSIFSAIIYIINLVVRKYRNKQDNYSIK